MLPPRRCGAGPAFKYALGLELDDPGFHHSVLSDFRGRLLEEDGRAGQLLDADHLSACIGPGGIGDPAVALAYIAAAVFVPLDRADKTSAA